MKKSKVFEARLDYSKSIYKLIKDSQRTCELIFEDKAGVLGLFLSLFDKNEIENLFYKGSRENIVRKNKTRFVLNAIDENLFDSSRISSASVRIRFVSIKSIVPRGTIHISAHQVLLELKRRGLQIAGIKEILALGAVYPDFQKKGLLKGIDYFFDKNSRTFFIIASSLYFAEEKNLVCIRNFEGFSRDSMLAIIVPK